MHLVIGRLRTGSTTLGGALVGFLLAPLISSVLVVAGTIYVMIVAAEWKDTLDPLQMTFAFGTAVLLGTIIMGGPATYIGMALIGAPTWLLLRYTDNESGVAYTMVGVAGGWWLAPALGGHKWEGFPLDLIGAVGGGLTLLLFWLIARRKCGNKVVGGSAILV